MRFNANAECGIPRRNGERGQTILLVAISIVSLLMMAALAIDVVSLYVASTEIQRAADAAALAGAKAMADSGVTTLQPTDANVPQAELLAQDMATKAINAMVLAASPVNLVAGGTPVLSGGTPTFNWGQGNNNPHVTVTLQQSNLPTFFARVFGSRSAIANASATAEAYNPANLQTFTPIQTTCVKPWLIGNADPGNPGSQFVNLATGQVDSPAGNQVIGEQFHLTTDCGGGGANNCNAMFKNPPLSPGATSLQFVPLEVTTNAGDVCPSSTTSPCGGGNDPGYKSAIECCNITAYTCGGSVTNAAWTQTLNPEYRGTTSDLAEGTECLIHATGEGPGLGQDSLTWTAAFPNAPPRITAGSGPQAGNYVSTSSSIVTIPILSGATLPTTPPHAVTVVGFLQAFVNEVDNLSGGHRGDVLITVLNVIGCSQTPNGSTPVVGGNGASPIPVRLITPP